MTNYFGKARLKKIFYNYISDRSDLVKGIRADRSLYYEKFRGYEWLECYYNDYYHFKICTWGKSSKVVTLDEYCYNEKKDEYVSFNRVVSYYSNDFRPNPNNKNKSLDCYEIAKQVSENAKACQQVQQ